MKAGIRRMRARLSAYVKTAGEGEQILGAYRGRPVTSPESAGGVSMVDRGIEEGWITRPSQGGLEPIKRYRASRAISEVLAEDRG